MQTLTLTALTVEGRAEAEAKVAKATAAKEAAEEAAMAGSSMSHADANRVGAEKRSRPLMLNVRPNELF